MVDPDGLMFNGAYRCAAVIQANRAIPVYIVRDADPDLFDAHLMSVASDPLISSSARRTRPLGPRLRGSRCGTSGVLSARWQAETLASTFMSCCRR